MSPVAALYLLSFNPVLQEPDFQFINLKSQKSIYFYSFTKSQTPKPVIEVADLNEDHRRLITAGSSNLPAHKLRCLVLKHFFYNTEFWFSKNISALSFEARALLWLFAVH